MLFLWLSLKDAQFSVVTGVLSQADYRLIVPAVVMVLLTPVARAVRWRLLFYPNNRSLRLGKLYNVVLIGQLVNVVAPARLGEVVRAYLVGEIEGKSKVSALGTIIVEKSIDALMLLVVFLILMTLMPLPLWLRGPRIGMIAAAIGVLLVALVSSTQKERWLTLLKCPLRFMPEHIRLQIARYADLSQSSLTALSHPSIGLQAVGWTILIWFLSALINYLVLVALKLDLSFLAASFLLLVLQLGVAIPSSPGKVGIFHYLCVVALSVFSVERNLAISYATLLYVVVVLLPSLLGAFLIWRESLSLQSLEQTAVDPLAGT